MVKGSEGCVRLDSVGVAFDDERLVANAGLVLIATLARRLGIGQSQGIWSPSKPGRFALSPACCLWPPLEVLDA
jgi:hypothetical protein